ncbi:MAG TPA: YIP1 family protein [Bacteroidota bacterium]|nr:YIP1 family protein [Bacteroidota bacterium]
MIICPVCTKENHHLAVTCTACGSFLQQRIENLDLFATIGHLAESPGKTFHTIAVARHKNFAYILATAFGWPVVFTFFWYIHAGELTRSLLTFLTAGILLGPAVGLIGFHYGSFLLWVGARAFRSTISFRNAFATTVYSAVPFLIPLLVLLPMAVLTYGLFFFTKNPSPYELKPLSFILIAALAGLSYFWSALLYLIGIRRVTGIRWFPAVVLWIVMLALAGLTAGALLYSLSGWSS